MQDQKVMTQHTWNTCTVHG